MKNASVKKLIDFIWKSPTGFHAIAAIEEELKDFTRLEEHAPWKLAPGGKYYVTRNQSSVIAFTLPKEPFSAFQLIASHSDSPTFKIKENAEVVVREHYVQLDTERYGGMIMSSWFDRPLSVAGRALVRLGTRVETRLVNLDRDTLIIPNVAIHMNRDVNNGYKYNPAVDLFPLFGGKDVKGLFKKEIAKAAGVKEEELLGSDLFLYNRMKGKIWGARDEYVSAPRLDDLECAFSSVEALKGAAVGGRHANVCCVFDNEEVGSTTKQGANSSFLYDVLRRIMLALGKGEEEYYTALAGSFMLSADNAHAVHPNHPEYSDAQNCTFMNEGIVIKFNANQKYTTDGVSEAVFHEICERAGVPVQHYANRSDMAGGGTLGNISSSHVSINTLDIGLPQLAMHSCYETAGVKDVDFMIKGMKAFLETDIQCLGNGDYALTPIMAETGEKA